MEAITGSLPLSGVDGGEGLVGFDDFQSHGDVRQAALASQLAVASLSRDQMIQGPELGALLAEPFRKKLLVQGDGIGLFNGRPRQGSFRGKIQIGVEAGHGGTPQIVEGRQTVFELSQLHLGANQVGVRRSAHGVPGLSDLFQIAQQSQVLFGDRDGLGQIGVFVIGFLDAVAEVVPDRWEPLLGGEAFLSGGVPSQSELPEPGENLRQPETVALGARAGLHFVDEIGVGEAGVGKRAHLGDFFQGRFPAKKGPLQGGVVGFRVTKVVFQGGVVEKACRRRIGRTREFVEVIGRKILEIRNASFRRRTGVGSGDARPAGQKHQKGEPQLHG